MGSGDGHQNGERSSSFQRSKVGQGLSSLLLDVLFQHDQYTGKNDDDGDNDDDDDDGGSITFCIKCHIVGRAATHYYIPRRRLECLRRLHLFNDTSSSSSPSPSPPSSSPSPANNGTQFMTIVCCDVSDCLCTIAIRLLQHTPLLAPLCTIVHSFAQLRQLHYFLFIFCVLTYQGFVSCVHNIPFN